MWFVRAVRGAFLVALVIAMATSASYLLATTRSAPSAAAVTDPAAAEVVDPSSTDASTADAAGSVADVPSGDHPVDLSADLVDASQPEPPAADSEPALDPSEVVQLAAPAASEQFPDSASQGQYKRTVLANLAYGSGAANIGLSSGPGKRPIGPASFAVDATGAIFVSDNVNGRVQVFSSQGSPVRSLKVDTYVYDLAAGEANDLYLLGVDGTLVTQDAATGKVKAKGAVSGTAAEELGKLRVANGQLALESPRQVTYPLGVSRNGGMALLSSQEQQNGQRKGASTRSQDHYSTSYRDGGHVYRLDDKGNTVQDISLRLSDIATVVFLEEDRVGNIYVQVERATDNGQVSVEVRQFSNKGELIAVVPMDRVDYVAMTKSTIVADDGTIYQLVPTAQGIALVKYQRS